MTEQSGYLAAGSQQLHYLKWGSGKCLLLAFHGYGDTSQIFLPVVSHLQQDYTIISIDLPHHGGSNWSEGVKLSLNDLSALIEGLLKVYKVEKVSLLGYSLGGRVCLALISALPTLIDKVILIAPDGLRKDPYYYFFTKNYFGKKFFRNMLLQPGPYFRIMKLLRNIKLVHNSRYKFAMHFMQSTESREFLLRVWPSMSEIMPEPKQVKNVIATHQVSVIIFMGAYDKIITASLATKFSDGLGSVQVHILEKGHRILDHESAQQIAASLL